MASASSFVPSNVIIGKNRPISGSLSKVKVWLNKVGLVVPVTNPNDKVEKLLQDITRRFEGHGIKPGELRLAEIRTSDGCLISLHDTIKDVIDHGESLNVLDFDTWIETQKPLCKDVKLIITREDFEDDDPKWIAIGIHEFNKLFVKFGTYWPGSREKFLGLELIDTDALQNFGKEGKILLGSKSAKDGSKKWNLEAYFIVKGGTVQEIELSAKSSSDSKPIIKTIQVKVGRKLELGEIKVIQDDKDNYDPAQYKLPLPQVVGSSLKEEDMKEKKFEVHESKLSGASPHQAGNASPLQITQLGKIEPDMGWESDGEWDNVFYSNFNLLNKSQTKLAVVNVDAEYLDLHGKWVRGTCKIGRRNGFYDYSFQPEKSNHFNMEPMEQRETAIYLGVTIKAPQLDRCRRSHKSLPDPLKIKITFEDSNGCNASILIDYLNPALDVTTKDEREKKNNEGNKFDFWAQCDDTDYQLRIWAEAKNNVKDERVEIYLGYANKNKYLYESECKKLAYKAVKEQVNEKEMEDLNYDYKGIISTKVFAVVDLKNQRTYALKFVLKIGRAHV